MELQDFALMVLYRIQELETDVKYLKIDFEEQVIKLKDEIHNLRKEILEMRNGNK